MNDCPPESENSSESRFWRLTGVAEYETNFLRKWQREYAFSSVAASQDYTVLNIGRWVAGPAITDDVSVIAGPNWHQQAPTGVPQPLQPPGRFASWIDSSLTPTACLTVGMLLEYPPYHPFFWSDSKKSWCASVDVKTARAYAPFNLPDNQLNGYDDPWALGPTLSLGAPSGNTECAVGHVTVRFHDHAWVLPIKASFVVIYRTSQQVNDPNDPGNFTTIYDFVEGDTLNLTQNSVTVSSFSTEITVKEFYPYAGKDGAPIYNTSTGAILDGRDPLKS